jgi:hypothetical protein
MLMELIGYVMRCPGGKEGKRTKKQYRRDQTERRQKRIERSKAKGASKDVWGLRREGKLGWLSVCCVFTLGDKTIVCPTQARCVRSCYTMRGS